MPQNKSTLHSSLESRVAGLKTKLEVEDKAITGHEGALDLQQFLAEIKDVHKEHIFAEKNEGSMDGAGQIMQPCRHNYTDATCTNYEEHFSVPIEKYDCVRPVSYQ